MKEERCRNLSNEEAEMILNSASLLLQPVVNNKGVLKFDLHAQSEAKMDKLYHTLVETKFPISPNEVSRLIQDFADTLTVICPAGTQFIRYDDGDWNAENGSVEGFNDEWAAVNLEIKGADNV